MAKNFFMMKAHHHDYQKHYSPQNFWSVKLDGMRALWDGGITKGRTDVPWALGKTATGLWSMNAKIIHAPDWYTQCFPPRVLDGELWAGTGNFQKVMSVCRSHKAGCRWKDIKFVCYDQLYPGQVFIFRHIDEPNCQLTISLAASLYFKQLCDDRGMLWYSGKGWEPLALNLKPEGEYLSYLEHAPVKGRNWEEQKAYLEYVLDTALEQGHEGIMVRKAGSLWTPIRSHDLTKLKPFQDAEATVIGVQFGKETDRGSRLLGKMGSLICKWGNKKIKVSGFLDEEREVADATMAAEHPGEESYTTFPYAFPKGTKITFKYRECTDNGMPKDPRYWRNRPEE